jgi:hypothetical protein
MDQVNISESFGEQNVGLTNDVASFLERRHVAAFKRPPTTSK